MSSRVAVVAALACVALLAGCAPAAADPMSDQLRSAIRQDRSDQAWSAVSEQYPEALRPEITVGPVLDDARWAVATKRCFADEGFIVVRVGSTFQYSSSQGQSPLQFAVAQYHCTVALPSLGEMTGYLDVYQLGDLYDFFFDVVRPCLALNGVAPSRVPSRSAFESGRDSTLWTPFTALDSAKKTDARRLADLETVCAPVPGWLHL